MNRYINKQEIRVLFLLYLLTHMMDDGVPLLSWYPEFCHTDRTLHWFDLQLMSWWNFHAHDRAVSFVTIIIATVSVSFDASQFHAFLAVFFSCFSMKRKFLPSNRFTTFILSNHSLSIFSPCRIIIWHTYAKDWRCVWPAFA